MRALAWGDPPTFRARLMACTALLSLGVLTAASLTVYVGASRALHANLDDALLTIAHTQVAAALHEPDAGIDLPPGLPAHLSLPAGSGYEEFVQIEDARGRVVARTANLERGLALRPDPRLASAARTGALSFGDTPLGSAPGRAIYYPLRDRDGSRLVAVIAVAQEPMRRSLRSLLGAILVALAFAGAAAAWASGRLASRLTQPLGQIAAVSRSVGEDNLGARIPAVSRDEELRHVTDVLNDMLSRLEAAFQNQRRFVADASHELRSPLANLRGTVEVALRRRRSAEEYEETLCVTLREVERLSRLVADLLTLSRADAGGLPIKRTPLSLAEVARQAAGAAVERARGAGLEIDVRSPEPVWVLGDADRIRQVVDNLLDNAVRHAPGGSAVEVEVRRDDVWAVLSVRDHGPGIPAEARPRIFERFYRADPSRARKSGGTGLGLAIAHAVVSSHGGRITAEPADEGALFVVRLPAVDTPRGGPAPGEAPLAGPGARARSTP